MDQLAKWMKTNKVSGSALAELLGTTRQMTSLWTTGNGVPGPYYQRALEIATEGAVPADTWLTPAERLALDGVRARTAARKAGE